MIHIKTFPCGLKSASRNTRSQVTYIALTIKSGTRNEPEELCGIAHMTEHMLFKGTEKRTPKEICDRLEKCGGELNAYTTKEETVLYATVLKEDAAKAADLLFELAFTSTFGQKELDKERCVVIDEINMYKDSPSECIFEDFEAMLFEGHPLGKSILGTAKSLKKISSESLKEYASNGFRPENMCLTIVGGISPQRAEKIAAQAVGKYIPEDYIPAPQLESAPAATLAGKQFYKEVSKKNHQVNCIIGTTACSFYGEQRMKLILLANILGGPSSNSRLNQSLREKKALVYGIDATFTQYCDSGSFMIYFGCEKPNLEKCLELVEKEISLMREKPLGDKALKAAKKQFLGQLAISSDNGETQALSMGKSLTVFGRIMADDEVRRKINSITSEELQDVARTVLAKERLSTLIYK